MPGPSQYGFKAAGEMRPRPKLRRYYMRKANRQAKKLYQPERQLYRRQLSQLRRRQQREMQSVPAAIGMFTDVINQAQSGLKDSGLKGRYLKQTASELANRQVDVAQAAPMLQQQIRQDYMAPRQDIRSAIAESRINQQQDAQQTFASFLAGAMEEAQPVVQKRLQRQRQQERGGEDGGLSRPIRIGLQQAGLIHERNMTLLNTPDKRLSTSAQEEKAAIKAALEDPDFYWANLADQVSGSEGVDPLQAVRASNIYRRQLDEGARRGATAGLTAAAGGVANAAVPGISNLFDLWTLMNNRGR